MFRGHLSVSLLLWISSILLGYCYHPFISEDIHTFIPLPPPHSSDIQGCHDITSLPPIPEAFCHDISGCCKVCVCVCVAGGLSPPCDPPIYPLMWVNDPASPRTVTYAGPWSWCRQVRGGEGRASKSKGRGSGDAQLFCFLGPLTPRCEELGGARGANKLQTSGLCHNRSIHREMSLTGVKRGWNKSKGMWTFRCLPDDEAGCCN